MKILVMLYLYYQTHSNGQIVVQSGNCPQIILKCSLLIKKL